MEHVEILAQVLGVGGMTFNIAAMQCRKTAGVITMRLIGAVLFTVSYLLLGSYASAMMNLYGILLSTVLLIDKRERHPMQLVILMPLLVLCCGVGFYADGWITLLPFFGQVGSTLSMWMRNGAKLHLIQLTLTSPCWFINNIVVFSIGGILCEMITITSVLVSILRYGWKNLKESD